MLHILKQTCSRTLSVQLQVCLSMCDLFVTTRHSRVNMFIKRKTRAGKAYSYRMLLSFRTLVTYEKLFNFTQDNCGSCETAFVGNNSIFCAVLIFNPAVRFNFKKIENKIKMNRQQEVEFHTVNWKNLEWNAKTRQNP